MSDQARPVPMHLVHPGMTTTDDEFMFELEARENAARTVKFVLSARDAETLHHQLGLFLKDVSPTKTKY